MRTKEINTTKARSKLNSIENVISKVIATAEIINEDFALISNASEKYRKLRENIRIIKSQIGGIEKSKLIEDDKGMRIDKILNNSSSGNRDIIIAHSYCMPHPYYIVYFSYQIAHSSHYIAQSSYYIVNPYYLGHPYYTGTLFQ